MLKVLDVGGQRSERRKWAQIFGDNTLTAIIFFVAMSEYDMVLYENNQINRMTESIVLFEEVSNAPFFINIPLILFLNKIDIFEEKIKVSHITAVEQFKEYEGPQEFEACKEYIKVKFLELNHNPRRTLYHHFTCATHQDQIMLVWKSVVSTVLQQQIDTFILR